MKRPKLNRDWHKEHRMPVNATMEQRVQWHLEHADNCGCRPIPSKIAEELKMRGIVADPQVILGALIGVAGHFMR